MYFTQQHLRAIVISTKGNTTFHTQRLKEDMVMLKKIALFLEEYYDECGRK